MKILLISPYFFEPHRWMISAYKTALYLSKKIPIIVYTTGDQPHEKISDNLEIYRKKDLFIPDPVNFSIVPGMFGGLTKLIRKHKPDIFIVNKHMFYTSLSAIWLKIINKKVIVQVDTFPGINWFSKSLLVNIILWIYARTLGLLILKVCNKVVLLHEGLIPIAKKYHFNYTVIHNGVDIESIDKAEKDKSLNNKPEGEVRVVYVGRLESVKGYPIFLEAARELSIKYPNLKFFLIGNTAGKEKLVEEYQNNGIFFLGHKNSVNSIIKLMDIFVLPSYSEGLPNALMEAMAARLACISSDVGGVKVLIKNKRNGLLFKPGDVETLKTHILHLYRDPSLRKKYAEEGRKTIEESFNWSRISQQYYDLCKNLLDSK